MVSYSSAESAEPRPQAPAAAAQRQPPPGLPQRSLTPARRFQLVSLLVLLAGMLSAGWWLSIQIEDRVIWNTVRVNSLYVESLITPALQGVGRSAAMSASDIAVLDQTLRGTVLGQELAGLILWGEGGLVRYSSVPGQIGQRFDPDDELADASAGQVAWELTDARAESHIPPQQKSEQLIAIYSPVRKLDSGHVIGVIEFYLPFDPIARDIALVQKETWAVVGGVTIVMYLLLAGYIQQISGTIVGQVKQLTALLEQNAELYERMQRATHRAATSHERSLRRISADLHDGIAQYLGAAMLHLGRIASYSRGHPDVQLEPFVSGAQSAVSRAIQETRSMAAGLGIPQIEPMPLDAVITSVVDAHEQLTGSEVMVTINSLPEKVDLGIKVTTYRIIQEGLSNAYRHGKGRGQRVEVIAWGRILRITVADSGPGFQAGQAPLSGDHMGIAGMRDRVESLGGSFSISSAPGRGTELCALLPLDVEASDV